MANAAQFSSAEPGAMGTPLAVYKPGGRRRGFSIFFGFLLCVGGGVAVLFGAARAGLKESDRAPLIVIGVICVLLGWLAIESWLRTRNLTATLTADGVTYDKNGSITSVRFDEIVGFWQNITKRYYNGVYTGTTHVYTVQKSDGKKVVFNDTLKNVEELGNAIQGEVTQRHLPRAFETYNNGGTVSFGNVSLSRTGLTKGGKTLPWNEIQGVQIQKGYITVKQQGKWLRWANIPVSSIPNMVVFLTLVDRIVGVNTPKK